MLAEGGSIFKGLRYLHRIARPRMLTHRNSYKPYRLQRPFKGLHTLYNVIDVTLNIMLLGSWVRYRLEGARKND